MVRNYGVWIALLLTLAACYWVDLQEAENAEEAVTVAVNQTKVHAQKPITKGLSSHRNQEELILRSTDLTPPQNLFSALATDNAEAELAENQVPTTPANPYTYAGKISEDNIWTVFLTDGTNNFAVKAGGELQGGWRVKRIQREELTLVYMPLKQEIKLNIGATL